MVHLDAEVNFIEGCGNPILILSVLVVSRFLGDPSPIPCHHGDASFPLSLSSVGFSLSPLPAEYAYTRPRPAAVSLTQHLAFRGGLVPQAPHSLSVAFVLELMRKPTCLWDQELKQCGPGGYLPSHLGTALLRSRGTAVWCRLP